MKADYSDLNIKAYISPISYQDKGIFYGKKAHPLFVICHLPKRNIIWRHFAHSIRKTNLVFPDDFHYVKNWEKLDTAQKNYCVL